MLAYLTCMAERIEQMHRLLKPTGSLFLHCDPTSSHYLKLLLDAVFGPTTFRGEVVWKRTSAHSDTKQGSRQPGRIHDVLLLAGQGAQIDTTTAAGRLVFGIFAALAEFEREPIRD